jgi:hypothetical protein
MKDFSFGLSDAYVFVVHIRATIIWGSFYIFLLYSKLLYCMHYSLDH